MEAWQIAALNARTELFHRLVDAFPADAGVHELQSLFRDTSHQDYPICTPYSDFLGLQVGTVRSVVMDLPNKTVHISIGNPNKSDYHLYTSG